VVNGVAMKRIFIIGFFLLSLSACGGGGGAPTINEPAPIVTPIILLDVSDYEIGNTDALLNQTSSDLEGLPIDDFFEQAFQLMQNRNVEGLISDGNFNAFANETAQLNNISDDFAGQNEQLYHLLLNQLESYSIDSLTAAQKLSYDIVLEDLQFKIQWLEYRKFEYPATYGFFGWPGATEIFFNQAFTFTNKEQAQLYLNLLNQVGRRFEQIGELLAIRKAQGIIEPAVTLRTSQQAVANMANTRATSTSYYLAFDAQITALSTINASDKAELRNLLLATIEQRVLPAYTILSEQMELLLAQAPTDIGFGQFTGGKDFYNFTLKYYTSGNLTADQIHQLGLTELARIHYEMKVLFNQLGYPEVESLASSYARVNNDAGIISANDKKALYETIIAQAYLELPKLFEVLPQQQVIVVGGESGGYYIAGSDDGSRPGAFYANTSRNEAYTTMPTLAYHEAVPGHHLQIALANELNIPLYRRKIHFTSFIEGWALYAERLAKESMWYVNDVYGDLGRLQFEAMRAARLVVDTGIHSKAWSFDQANQFHQTNVGFPGSIARYSVLPGQATAYMTGMLKILSLRQSAKEQLGDLFDIKEFHSAVLGDGGVPLNILQTIIDDYIAKKLTENN